MATRPIAADLQKRFNSQMSLIRLLSAIFDPEPAIVVQDRLLSWMPGEVPEGDYPIPLGQVRLIAEGSDCSVVACGAALHMALKGVQTLAATVRAMCDNHSGGR